MPFATTAPNPCSIDPVIKKPLMLRQIPKLEGLGFKGDRVKGLGFSCGKVQHKWWVVGFMVVSIAALRIVSALAIVKKSQCPYEGLQPIGNARSSRLEVYRKELGALGRVVFLF